MAAADLPPYLGVAQSVTGRRWQGLSPAQERDAERLAQSGQPLALSRHLAQDSVYQPF